MPLEELDFGDNVTNNQAEYGTLLAGLRRALNVLRENGSHPSESSIDIYTDSKLVVEQVSGRWKVKNEGLKPLQREARMLLSQFGKSRLTWHPRAESVRVLGH
jgi:ribonuclease HI